ncbi:MAG: hypothetical protein K5696_10835 [Lachnospiraceae bacterium]|nr:hypothetical protein [Lachnospiraceae bacterium]
MKEINLVIVDEDAEFLRRLDGCLRARLGFPASVCDYTEAAMLASHPGKEETAVLILPERMLDKVSLEGFPRVVILDEGLGIRAEAPVIRRIGKYRPLGGLIDAVTEMVMESGMLKTAGTGAGNRARLIGFFTPVSRCLQTTASLTLGQLLASDRRVLWIGCEAFSGQPGPGTGEGSDLTELLYYEECEQDRTALHIERTRIRIGALDVIAPPALYTTVTDTEPERWRELFVRIAEKTDYDCIIADLRAGIRGLTELLGVFDRIVMIGRQDPVSAERTRRLMLSWKRMGSGDLPGRVRQVEFPVFRRLPADPSRYGEGELAECIRQYLHAQDWIGEEKDAAGKEPDDHA